MAENFKRHGHNIGIREVPPADGIYFPTENPHTGQAWADIASGREADANAAARAGQERAGAGRFIDAAMQDSTMATMGWVVSNCLITGQVPIPMGNDNFTAAPSGTFKTSDGLLNISANKQEQFLAPTVMNGGYIVSEYNDASKLPPPALGEHTDEIMTELGYTPAEIAQSRADKEI